MSKKRKFLLLAVWMLLFIIAEEFTTYLINNNLFIDNTLYKLIAELYWMSLGAFGFWVDRFIKDKSKNKNRY